MMIKPNPIVNHPQSRACNSSGDFWHLQKLTYLALSPEQGGGGATAVPLSSPALLPPAGVAGSPPLRGCFALQAVQHLKHEPGIYNRQPSASEAFVGCCGGDRCCA